MGKTTHQPEVRIKPHGPNSAVLAINAGKKVPTTSAICERLKDNPECGAEIKASRFTALHRARNKNVLDTLEAECITALQPELCKRMKFVKQLHLFHAAGAS